MERSEGLGRRSLRCLAVLGFAVLAAGCGSDTVQTADLEPQILDGVQSDLDPVAEELSTLGDGIDFDVESVECPGEVEDGASFDCDATAAISPPGTVTYLVYQGEELNLEDDTYTTTATVTVDGDTVDVETDIPGEE